MSDERHYVVQGRRLVKVNRIVVAENADKAASKVRRECEPDEFITALSRPAEPHEVLDDCDE